MVYRRSGRRTKKKSYGRKRTYRRNFKRQAIKPRVNGKVFQPIHYYVRHVDLGTISGDSGGTDTLGSLSFKLSDVPSFAEFTAMYRQFKICAVKVQFIPISNVTYSTSIGTEPWSYNYYRFLSVIDYTSSGSTASLNELRQYSNCKVSANNRIHKRFLYPKALVVMDEDSASGSTTSYANPQNTPWIGTQADACQFFGIKYGFEQLSNDNNQRYRVECKYYLAFKQPR